MRRLRRSQAFCSRFQIEETVFMKSKLLFSFFLVQHCLSIVSLTCCSPCRCYFPFIDRSDEFFILFHYCINDGPNLISLIKCWSTFNRLILIARIRFGIYLNRFFCRMVRTETKTSVATHRQPNENDENLVAPTLISNNYQHSYIDLVDGI